ncbi:MAG: DUF1559 domain-containing protein, partial [Pirellula sp.]
VGHTPGTQHFDNFWYDIGGAPNAVRGLGQTNYLHNRGYVRNDQYEGPFTYSPKLVSGATGVAAFLNPPAVGQKFSGVSDGLSNTAFMLESAGGFVSFGANNPANGWGSTSWGHAPSYSDYGVCPNSTNTNCINTPQGRGLSAGLPGSLHAGRGINTVFGDGSVRSINPSLTFATYVYICGGKDGEVVAFEE